MSGGDAIDVRKLLDIIARSWEQQSGVRPKVVAWDANGLQILADWDLLKRAIDILVRSLYIDASAMHAMVVRTSSCSVTCRIDLILDHPDATDRNQASVFKLYCLAPALGPRLGSGLFTAYRIIRKLKGQLYLSQQYGCTVYRIEVPIAN